MKPFTWSYSALTMFEQCPKKYYHIYVAKDAKDEDSQWSQDGKAIHNAMKARVVDNVALPMPMRPYEKAAAKFSMVSGEKYAEQKLALNRQFEPCDFFASDVWVRVVIDLAIVQPHGSGKRAFVIDWKTGKVKDDLTQNALNCAVLSRWMPEVGLFIPLYVWLQHNTVTPNPPKTYTISMFQNKVWNDLLPRVNAIEQARKTTSFEAKPGPLCRFCPVRQCPHYEARAE